jgi:hypothetical protein
MLQRAADNVGDDFHVAVRVHAKAHLRRDAVLVDDAQGAKVGVGRIVVIGEAEGVAGLEPAVVGVAPVFGFAEGDHVLSFVANT